MTGLPQGRSEKEPTQQLSNTVTNYGDNELIKVKGLFGLTVVQLSGYDYTPEDRQGSRSWQWLEEKP